ncbi:MAG: TonB-dependent receptor [Desulfobacteraceae bacterium]|nr:TonB-dependent receptor [Desulfobacteraceae bacterium]MBC2720572.1 TonB-dependent receptor [Desulfobacteraceae bacterium]
MRKGVLLSLVVSGIIIMQAAPIFAEETATVGEIFYLGQVLVTGKKGDVDLATTVSVVSSEDIERQGAQNVAEALDQIPGIDVRMGNKGNASLKLRGFDQQNVKVLIDGVPAHEAYFGSLDLDQIPVDAIAKIEVTKGASSVLYGSNTMGGVINIITKKAGDKPVTRFVTSFGENSTHNFSANHGASVGKFNYWLTYSYRGTDGFELSDDFDKNNDRTGLETGFNEDGGLRDLSYFTKRTLNAKVGYKHDTDSKLYLSFDYHNNEKGCTTERNRYWAFTEWDQWHLNLIGEHDLTDILTMKARFFYVKHDDTLKDVSWDNDHKTARKWFEESSYDDYSIGGELQSYVDFGQWSLLKIGVNYLKDNHKQQDFLDAESLAVKKGAASPGLTPEEEYKSETYSFAMENEIMVMDNLSFIAGFSYDVNEPKKANDQPVPDKMDTFNPQTGVVYEATDTLSLHASVGKKTRFPQLIELYSNSAGGNPNLDPQQTIAYELGASKKINNFLKTSMAIFYNDIEDRIMRIKNAYGDKEYVNMGESTIYGAEFDMTCYTRFGLNVGLNYTYLNAKEKEDSGSKERDAENTPDHKVNMDVGYTFAFLSTYLQASYTADQIEYDDDDNKVDLDDFIVINCKVSQDFASFINIDSTVFMEVKNIMDEDYEESNGPMPGRSFLVGLTARF